jgi:hypothetical protein
MISDLTAEETILNTPNMHAMAAFEALSFGIELIFGF